MIFALAEKPDVATKIVAAFGCLNINGRKIDLTELDRFEKEIKAFRSKKGFYEAEIFGEKVIVSWSYGHLVRLKEAVDYNPEYKNWDKIPLPFIPEHYEYTVIEGTEQRLNYVSKMLKNASKIYCCLDDDREGLNIYSSIAATCGISDKPYLRVLLKSQIKEGIIDAFKNAESSDLYRNTEKAGKCRSVGDYLYGLNLTTAATLTYAQPKTLLSVGRVQTCVLAMIVQRDKEIENFIQEPFWNLDANFTTENDEKYKGRYTETNLKTVVEANKLMSKIKDKPFLITEINEVQKTNGVPLLYNLASLQEAANRSFGFSLQKTLDIAQKLYEKGLTTYPRTDSPYLTEDMPDEVVSLLTQLEKIPRFKPLIEGRTKEFNKKFFNNEKTQSHYAIIPTRQMANLNDLTKDEQKLYIIIAFSLIRMIYPPMKIKKTVVTTTYESYAFLSKGIQVLDPGWTIVGNIKNKEVILPPLKKGDQVNPEFSILEGKTTPPNLYTEATLSTAMSTCGKKVTNKVYREILLDERVKGIGRPSSRGAVIETLKKRNYIVSSGKTIKSTALGRKLIQILPVEEVKSPEMTAVWENRLTNIENGIESGEKFIEDIEEATAQYCQRILSEKGKYQLENNSSAKKTFDLKCPKCGGRLIFMEWGVGCANYNSEPKCTFKIFRKQRAKKLSDKNLSDLLLKGKTNTLTFKSVKKGISYTAYLTLKDTGECDLMFPLKK